MVGIVSYGVYLPRLRLNRKSIFTANSWMSPGVHNLSKGERTMCNWDEDALTMAVEASRNCTFGLDKKEIDAVYLASTSLPFQDRQNAGILATALNLKANIATADLTSSQRAGTSAFITGLHAIKGGDLSDILIAASDHRITRIGSSQEMLFGDGAAALLLGSNNVIAEYKGSYSISDDFVDHYRGQNSRFDYRWEERWIRDEGYNKVVTQTINGLFEKVGITGGDIDRFVMPCVFNKISSGLAKKFGIDQEKVCDNMHLVSGETGTAHSLMMLASILEKAKPGEKILLIGYGQGCDVILLETTGSIKDVKAGENFRANLSRRKEENNYMKFLAFNDLVTLDKGIREETMHKTSTALSVMYRKKKMILGLVGGKCNECGTPQFPKMDICVNPECKAAHTQVDYEFAYQPAKVLSWTSDSLTYAADPPALYGMIQFDNGGRIMADLTDLDQDEVRTGMPVKMVFRIKLVDKQRSFIRYFWKATPLI